MHEVLCWCFCPPNAPLTTPLYCLVFAVPVVSPSNVAVTPAGENRVRVSWTPTSETLHYVVTYESSTGERRSVTVPGMAADSAILEGLSVDVEYSITVQAFGDLPGPVSAPAATITLTGKIC